MKDTAAVSAPLGNFSRLIDRIPEPFTLSLILTVIAFAAALAVGQKTAGQLAMSWTEGLWSISTFAMQMVLCLSTGFAFAQAPVLEKQLKKLCALPRSYAQSVALVAFVSMVLGVVHWGLGLAGGTLLVRQMKKTSMERGFGGPDGLLGAAGYLPLMIWHGGLSGSAPLLMSSDGHFMMAETGVLDLTTTIGHWSNIVMMAMMIPALTLICYRWARNYQEELTPVLKLREREERGESLFDSPELKLPWLGLSVGLVGLAFTAVWVAKTGFTHMGLDHLNSLFLFLGLTFHARLGSFLGAFKNGVQSSYSVVLLFPFYGALMSLVRDSGLAAMLSHSLAEVATTATLPLYTFFSACLLNIFIPSGGGQWVVQGPIAVAAGKELGLEPGLMVMAVAYGDQLTNMLQPFWALPLLGVTQISSKDLLRFTVPLMFFGGAFMAIGLFLHAI